MRPAPPRRVQSKSRVPSLDTQVSQPSASTSPRAHGRAVSGSDLLAGQHVDSPRRRNQLSVDSPSDAPAYATTSYLVEPRSSNPSDFNFSSPTFPLPNASLDPAMTADTYGALRAFYERNRGLFYVLLAQVFGVLMNVTTRLLEIEGNRGDGMHPFQILFVRMTITTALTTVYMWWSRTPNFPLGIPEVRWLLVLRGIGGFFGVFGMYYSLLYLPLADAIVITFITPSLSCWISAKLINEPFTRMEQIGALISFVGVTLIARPTSFFHGAPAAPAATGNDAASHAEPPPTHKVGVADLASVTTGQRVFAICIALTGVMGSAMAFVAMRWIGKRASPLLSVNYFCVCVTVVSAAAMFLLPDVDFLLPATGKEWVYLVFLGCCGFAMQFLLSAGLQHEKSSRATLMTYSQMIFALFFDKIIFDHNATLASIFGSLLIVGSAVYIALQKESDKQRAEAEKQKQQDHEAAGQRVEMADAARPRSSVDEEQGLMDPAASQDRTDGESPAESEQKGWR